jgi:predicted regulator of Ras-like GTPase activity (Roadblock/LC7/MglB family)
MTLKGPEFNKALLLGLMAAAVPLIYYPHTFGWSQAAAGSAAFFLVEFLYYVLVFQFLLAREPQAHRVKASAVSLVFRVCMGLVFAVLAGGFFGLDAGAALAMGVYGYLPAALLHMAVVPHLLRPVFRFREPRKLRPAGSAETALPRAQKPMALAEPHAWAGGSEHVPDFDAAVSHVASYSTVGLVLLVDEEGLSVARASRGSADSDLWAPVVNLLYDSILQQLRRTSDADVRRLQITLTRERLVVERVEPFYLAVLCDQNTDELVNVRIAQAVEMIRKYYDHKYRKVAHEAAAEVAYV